MDSVINQLNEGGDNEVERQLGADLQSLIGSSLQSQRYDEFLLLSPYYLSRYIMKNWGIIIDTLYYHDETFHFSLFQVLMILTNLDK